MRKLKSVGDVELSLAQAQAASQSGVIELLRARESKVLSELVSAHTSGKLTDRDAALGIAVISELRAAARHFTKLINEGIDVGESLTRRP